MSFLSGPDGQQVLPIKIAGSLEPLDTSRLFPVQSSITDEILHYAQSATPELAVKAAEASFIAFREWRKTKYTERRDYLFRVAVEIEAREARFVELQMKETSCSRDWAKFNVALAARCMREMASNISHVLTGELPPLESSGVVGLVYREPVGPVLAITPWNASLVLSSRSLAAPIGVGCSVVLKASELCPQTHHFLVEAFEAAGLPAGVINVLQAAREEAVPVTEALIAHPAIRKVIFTGSNAVGRSIGQMTSKNLKPVLMELGGKAPAVVLGDADVKAAAQHIILGAMIHHGQICMSTDRIIVVQDVAQDLIRELKLAIQQHFPNGAGHAVTRKQAMRAYKLLQEAHANGAEFVIGDGSLNATGSSLTPTIITNIKPTDAIFHEEIFAPVSILTIVPDADAAVRVANDVPYGLNAAVHGRDVFAALRVAKELESAQVHIGSMTSFDEATMPLGGSKGSGWGRNNGKYALKEFLEEKTTTIHDPSMSSRNRHGMADE